MLGEDSIGVPLVGEFLYVLDIPVADFPDTLVTEAQFVAAFHQSIQLVGETERHMLFWAQTIVVDVWVDAENSLLLQIFHCRPDLGGQRPLDWARDISYLRLPHVVD